MRLGRVVSSINILINSIEGMLSAKRFLEYTLKTFFYAAAFLMLTIGYGLFCKQRF